MGGEILRIERRFLANDPDAVAEVVRWVARALASPAFWSLRSEWRDLHQGAVGSDLYLAPPTMMPPRVGGCCPVQGIDLTPPPRLPSGTAPQLG